MKDVKSFSGSTPALNQFIKLLKDPEFRSFRAEAKEQLFIDAIETGKGKLPHFKAVSSCKREIRKFLHKKRLPQIWLEPIYSLLSGVTVNLPPDNGISIKVGDEDLTGAGDSVALIKNANGLLCGESALSIVVSAKTSTDHLIKFIENNSEAIQHWMDVLDLPEHQNMQWKRTLPAIEIIRLKDEESLTFDEISNRLASREDLSPKELDYLAITENIKTLYYRYKKLLEAS